MSVSVCGHQHKHYIWPDKVCSHKNKVEDYGSGTEVCTDCGLVVQDQLFKCYNQNSLQLRSIKDCSRGEACYSNYSLQKGIDLIYDVCSQFNITPQLCKTACALFVKSAKNNLKPSNINYIAAESFLKSSIRNQVPRTNDEICFMFKIDSKNFFKRSKKINQNVKVQIDGLKPSNIFPRLHFPFCVDFNLQSAICMKADDVFVKVNSCPKTVLAYVIYNTFSKSKQKSSQMRLTMKQAATICNVSPTSIKRLKKTVGNK